MNRFPTAPVQAVTALIAAALAACGAAAPQHDLPGAAADSAALTGAPQVLAVNRHGSPVEGGMQIFIAGSNLDETTAVDFGAVPAASVTAVPPSGLLTGGIVAVTPPHDRGYLAVTVTNADGASAVADASFHFGPAPVITSVSPTSRIRRGDAITIAGDNFGADGQAVQVSIGGAIALIQSKSATQLVVTAPKLNAGTYQVSVAHYDSQYAVAADTVTYK